MSHDAALGAEEVRGLACSLYGAQPEPLAGVIHTVAAVGTPEGRLRVIKIQPGAPRSSTDSFVLGLWRAHCDAVVISGQILRAEAALSYAPTGRYAAGLAEFRKRVLGKARVLRGVILTRSGDLPEKHPVFHEPDVLEPVVLTAPERVAGLQRLLGATAEVVGLPELDARAAVAWLQASGSAAIGIEAGPTLASSLYARPGLVDHLMLSICDAPVAPQLLGEALPENVALFDGMKCQSEVSRLEESGIWRFQHWWRATARAKGST
jgi:riboflavin biosynthesis pyrimidine reductase